MWLQCFVWPFCVIKMEMGFAVAAPLSFPGSAEEGGSGGHGGGVLGSGSQLIKRTHVPGQLNPRPCAHTSHFTRNANGIKGTLDGLCFSMFLQLVTVPAWRCPSPGSHRLTLSVALGWLPVPSPILSHSQPLLSLT